MRDLNSLTLDDLFAELTREPWSRSWIDAAFREDLGDPPGDVTSEIVIPAGALGAGTFVARRAGVVAGLALLPMLAERFAPGVELTMRMSDGSRADTGAALAEIAGDLRGILALERTALNTLGRLCGIASRTAEFVRAAEVAALYAGRAAPAICDTRKTTPGLRAIEKYAVRCGGGTLHRIGLHDAVLVKDNHLRAIGGADGFARLAASLRTARDRRGLRFLEVEVDTLEQFERLIAAAPGLIDIVLLDNMAPMEMANAVALRDALAPGLRLEASGGVSLAMVGEIAATGVDRISVGALTHSAPALDVALDLK